MAAKRLPDLRGALCLLLLSAPAWSEPWVQPFPLGVLDRQRLAVGAYLSDDLPAASWRLWVDEREVSAELQRGNGRCSWTPMEDLRPGEHRARLEATSASGQTVRRDWSFSLGAPTFDIESVRTQPAADGRPLLQVRYTSPADRSRLWIDGRDLGGSSEGGAEASWRPEVALAPGPHQARVQGSGGGTSAERSWTFTVKRAAADPRPVANSKPSRPRPPVAKPVLPPVATPTPPPDPEPVAVAATTATSGIAREPRPGSFTGLRPQLRLDFPDTGTWGEVRLALDGQPLPLGRNHNTVAWTAAADLAPGPHTLRLATADPQGVPLLDSWTFVAVKDGNPDELNSVLPAGDGEQEARTVQVKPVPTSQVPAAKLTVQFTLPAPEALARGVLVVDGQDVSAATEKLRAGLSYAPPQPLSPGRHSAAVVARSVSGRGYFRSWTFEVR